MVRYHLLEDIMDVKELTMQDVADNSGGLLSYDMIQKQLSNKNKIFKHTQIQGWINALGLSPEQVCEIFFTNNVT